MTIVQDSAFDDVDSDEEEDVEAFKAFVAPRKGDYIQRSDDTTVLTLHALSFRGDKQLTAHLQSSTFLTDDTEVGCCVLFLAPGLTRGRCDVLAHQAVP